MGADAGGEAMLKREFKDLNEVESRIRGLGQELKTLELPLLLLLDDCEKTHGEDSWQAATVRECFTLGESAKFWNEHWQEAEEKLTALRSRVRELNKQIREMKAKESTNGTD
jgi:hypothetical protein